MAFLPPHDPGRYTTWEIEHTQRAERRRRGIRDPYEGLRRLPFGKRVLVETALTLGALVIIALLVFGLALLFWW